MSYENSRAFIGSSAEPKRVIGASGAREFATEKPDGREYILSEVNDLSQEIEQIKDNPELMEFLAHRSQEKERFSLEQVKQKLGL